MSLKILGYHQSNLLKKLLSISTVTIFATAITACGSDGGGDSNGSNVDSEPEPNIPISPQPVEPTPTLPQPSEPVEPQYPNSNIILENTATLPDLIADTNPIQLQPSSDGIAALQSGVYTVDSRYVSSNNYDYDCENRLDEITCIVVTRYQLDAQSKDITIATWIYEPTKRQWRSAVRAGDETRLVDFNIQDNGGLTSDGRAWIYEPFSLIGSDFNVETDRLVYNYGQSKLDLTLAPVDYSNQYRSGESYNAIQFSEGAEGFDFSIKLQQGQLLHLQLAEKSSFNPTENTAPYNTLGKYRQVHSTRDLPGCFRAYSYSASLIFYPNSLGADLYQSNKFCEETGQVVTGVPILLQEGVTTIGNRKVIYLSNPDVPNAAQSQSTSQAQYLWAIALDEEGQPYQGRAHQVGYAERKTPDIFNKVALLDRVKRLSRDSEALDTPF